jgi:hypothetical protein
LEATKGELEQRKKKRNKEIEQKGFLPVNDEYNETMSSPQEVVEKDPKRFIIEECIPACKELWSKNIYTFMVSDHLNEGVCWIEIIGDGLSEDNKKIFMELDGEDVTKFSYHKGSFNFGVTKIGKEGQERLLELAKEFVIQDVPKDMAYITIDEFLMNYCNCYDEVVNPNYREMKSPWNSGLTLDELPNYMEEYDKWQDSTDSQETLKIFNPNKKEKDLEELVKEHNMVLEDDRVYLSEFHYEKHLNYVRQLGEMLASNTHQFK